MKSSAAVEAAVKLLQSVDLKDGPGRELLGQVVLEETPAWSNSRTHG